MSPTALLPTRPGVGIDVVELAGFRRRLDEQPALAGVLFTSREQVEARGRADPTAELAQAFAAKEAFVKALRRGLAPTGPDAWLLEVEVLRDATGAPRLVLGAAPQRTLAARGLGAPALALARDARHALATVLLAPASDASATKEGA